MRVSAYPVARMYRIKTVVYIPLAFCLAIICTGQEDLTRKNSSFGELVVDTVVNIIRESCILEDHLFLKRLALYESNYGMNFQTGFTGGIWQVDEKMFNVTKSKANSLASVYQQLQTELGIDWPGVKWTDLHKPLFSGLAAALYLRAVTNESIPIGVELQSKYWQKFYKPSGSANQFYMNVQNLMSTEGCRIADQADIVFVVEESAQMTAIDFAEVKTFMNDVVHGLHIANDLTRIGLVTFADQPKVNLYLKDGLSSTRISSEISKLFFNPRSSTSVSTGQTLDVVLKDVLTSANGARSNVAHVVVLITRSHSKNQFEAESAAFQLKNSGTRVIVIGIGNGVDESHLQRIASNPSCDNYRHLPAYTVLGKFVQEMEELVCQVPAVLKPGVYTYPCKVDPLILIPDDPMGHQITVSVTNDNRTVYGSSNYSLPGAALNDFHGEPIVQKPWSLFLRNNSHFYLSIQKSIASTCQGSFTIEISKGAHSTKQNVQVICIENNVQRNCTKQDLLQNQLSTQSNQNVSLPNICAGNITKAPHPSDPTKHLMCDAKGQLLVVSCPPKETFCVKTNFCESSCPSSSVSGSSVTSTASQIPVTSSASPAPVTSSITTQAAVSTTNGLATNKPIPLIFNPNGVPIIAAAKTTTTTKNAATTPNYLIASSLFPIILTPPPSIYSTNTPSYLGTTSHAPTTSASLTTSAAHSTNCNKNPCTVTAIASGFMFFPACDEYHYYQCTAIGTFKTEKCPTDHIYNPEIENCVNEFVYDETTRQYVKTFPNPCKGVKGDRYFTHPSDRSKFIHCDGFWNGFMNTCPTGQIYSSFTQSCIGGSAVG